MGTFCTTTSLATKMVGVEFDTATTLLADQCILDAENEIKKILSRRYDISSATFNTTTSIPPMVTSICQWLSMGHMYEDMARGGKESYMRSDRYIKKAMDNLNSIVKFEQNLFDTSGSLISDKASSMAILSSSDGYSDTFGEDGDLDWKVDSDKLQSIADERD